MTSARFHLGQNRRNTTQKTLSRAVSLGRDIAPDSVQPVVLLNEDGER